MTTTILTGDCRDILPTLAEGSVQTCVTSPPYFGLRNYNVDGQIGLEPTVEAFVAEMVTVFREVHRVLADDGCLFLNLGDSYFGGGGYSPNSPSNLAGSRQSTSKGSIKGRGRGSDALGYGTSGTVESGSPDRDSFSQSHDGGRTDSQSSHTTGSGCHPALVPSLELSEKTQGSMAALLDHLPSVDSSDLPQSWQSSDATLDLVRTAIHDAGKLLDALVSTSLESAALLAGHSMPTAPISACQWSLRSFVAGAQECARRLGDASETPRYTADIASPFEELAIRTQCIVSMCSTLSAWLNPPKVQPQYTAFKHKDLIGIPWRVAFALQADGWYLRQDIIWAKPNPMPESVTDRCTKSHEYLFLLTKSARYYYDAAAIAEPVAPSTVERLSQPNLANQIGSDRVPGKTNGAMKAVPPASHKGSSFDKGKTAEHQLGGAQQGPRFGGTKYGDSDDPMHATKSGNVYTGTETRNKRSVWTIPTQGFKDAHFATFPEALVEPCILAGSREGDTVLDPFGGSGTTAGVANRLGRHSVVIELNPDYIPMIERRTAQRAMELAS